MESLSLEKENIIRDIRNLFRKKELNYAAIKDIRNLLRLEKEAKETKDRVLRILLSVKKKKTIMNH